jgi:hypothetical protein
MDTDKRNKKMSKHYVTATTENPDGSPILACRCGGLFDYADWANYLSNATEGEDSTTQRMCRA